MAHEDGWDLALAVIAQMREQEAVPESPVMGCGLLVNPGDVVTFVNGGTRLPDAFAMPAEAQARLRWEILGGGQSLVSAQLQQQQAQQSQSLALESYRQSMLQRGINR